MIKFSIIVVCYNSGERLQDTVDSILNQTYDNYEIIIQDGKSSDGSIQNLPRDKRIFIYSKEDNGIYDAMNKACKHITGDFVLFLNSGDWLYENSVLEKVKNYIELNSQYDIYYGNNYTRSRNGLNITPEKISNFQMMTKSICHQNIYFRSSIFRENKYDYETYYHCADVAFYVKCVKWLGYRMKHIPIIVTNYEGNGKSEKIGSIREIVDERKKIMKCYFSPKEYFFANIKKIISLQGLKEYLRTIRFFYIQYEKIAKIVYEKRMKRYKN